MYCDVYPSMLTLFFTFCNIVYNLVINIGAFSNFVNMSLSVVISVTYINCIYIYLMLLRGEYQFLQKGACLCSHHNHH